MMLNTPNIKLLLSRLSDALFSWKPSSSLEEAGQLPDKVGDFEFVSEIQVDKSIKLYRYAIYKDGNGRPGFAKAWFGQRKNTAYYWLENGIAVLSAFTSIDQAGATPDKSKFRLPALYHTYKQKGCLMYISEYAPESQEDFTDEELVDLYDQAIKYTRSFGGKALKTLKAHILTISPYKILFSLPLISLKALLSRPSLWKEILRGFFFSLGHGPDLFSLKWNTLVHRDVRGTILKSGDKYYIVDWQTAAITNSMLEIAQLFFTYWVGAKLSFDIFKLETAREVFVSEKVLNSFKIICTYTALVEMGFVKIKSQEDEETFLKNLFALKGSAA